MTQSGRSAAPARKTAADPADPPSRSAGRASAGATGKAAAGKAAADGNTAATAADATRAPRRRQPPVIRRAMIIDAARELIAAQGAQTTTIRDIAAAARVAVGTVTYHFSGIAEVLAGVLETEMAQFSAPVMQAALDAPTGADGLAALTDGLIADGDRAAEHWKLWLDFWTLAAHQERYAAWQAQVYRDLHGLAATLFARGATDGSLPGEAGLDRSGASAAGAQRRAVEYIALMDGLVVQTYQPGSRLRPAEAREILHANV